VERKIYSRGISVVDDADTVGNHSHPQPPVRSTRAVGNTIIIIIGSSKGGALWTEALPLLSFGCGM